MWRVKDGEWYKLSVICISVCNARCSGEKEGFWELWIQENKRTVWGVNKEIRIFIFFTRWCASWRTNSWGRHDRKDRLIRHKFPHPYSSHTFPEPVLHIPCCHFLMCYRWWTHVSDLDYHIYLSFFFCRCVQHMQILYMPSQSYLCTAYSVCAK